MRILVIDDNSDLRDLVSRALIKDDHRVVSVPTSAGADEALAQGAFDIVVLDLALPDGWGATWCKRARREGLDAMVLLVSAHSDVEQRLEGFAAGADDFLAKPFAVAELRARVLALGRRRRGTTPVSILRGGDAEVDLAARRAWRAGAVAPLTAREWSVLSCLSHAQGRLVSKVTLLEEIWGDSSGPSESSLEVLIGRIRKKLGPTWIRTVRGEGYALGI